MKKIIPIVLMFVMLFSCKEQQIIAKDNLVSTSDCKCFDGIGSSKDDAPIITYKFKNNKSVNICGYIDKEMSEEYPIISEFNIFDCETGKSYVEYGALEICRIKQNDNELEIQQLRYLPVGKNWDWELIQIGEQTINPKGNSLYVSDLKPKLETYSIDSKEAATFLASIKTIKGYDANWEENIAKLEALSIIGNKEAWDILKNLENITGLKFDGALSEAWKSAIQNVNWINK